MIVARSRAELEAGLSALGPGTLSLVPTMGALHDGHLSLFDLGRSRADNLTCSLFVNPLQFGPGEDFDRYPRDLERDLTLLEDRDVDLVFAPTTSEMYPTGEPVVTVDPGPMGARLCGVSRPHHFRGVLTVVARLFGLIRPDVAVFGRKDFQQGVLVARMSEGLSQRVDIVMAPIIREDDGLAMSSRNRLLSVEARMQAGGLQRGLIAALDGFRAGQRDPSVLEALARVEISRHPLLELEYATLVGPTRLDEPAEASAEDVLAVAVRCGGVRLIDNVTLGSDQAG